MFAHGLPPQSSCDIFIFRPVGPGGATAVGVADQTWRRPRGRGMLACLMWGGGGGGAGGFGTTGAVQKCGGGGGGVSGTGFFICPLMVLPSYLNLMVGRGGKGGAGSSGGAAATDGASGTDTMIFWGAAVAPDNSHPFQPFRIPGGGGGTKGASGAGGAAGAAGATLQVPTNTTWMNFILRQASAGTAGGAGSNSSGSNGNPPGSGALPWNGGGGGGTAGSVGGQSVGGSAPYTSGSIQWETLADLYGIHYPRNSPAAAGSAGEDGGSYGGLDTDTLWVNYGGGGGTGNFGGNGGPGGRAARDGAGGGGGGGSDSGTGGTGGDGGDGGIIFWCW